MTGEDADKPKPCGCTSETACPQHKQTGRRRGVGKPWKRR